MTIPAQDPLDAPTAALAASVLEIARHVGEGDLPAPRLFALARSAELMAASPSLAALLGIGQETAPDPLHLTPIDLDDGTADQPTDPLAALEQVQWPDLAAGGALAGDLAPSAVELRGSEATDARPLGKLRVVVAALADGTTWSAVDRGDGRGYALGAALLPDITTALQQTFASD
ncbi:PPA1309 family protein [Brachybacterium sp. J153]|uniref:PPA1309 family protein n=1 Tax=Brachybacterium sp. J153 TaxID=3116488 RepID=UPI002E77A10D|nr:PPA1309 family protein [Brachybacterium sp. J153]MEE1617052.1 PPA1309 family protein [Brachybacterium sp. J153]